MFTFFICKKMHNNYKIWYVINNKGNNEEYNKNDNKDLEFVINTYYSLFNNKVYIDDELVDVSNYTSSNTNTTIV